MRKRMETISVLQQVELFDVTRGQEAERIHIAHSVLHCLKHPKDGLISVFPIALCI